MNKQPYPPVPMILASGSPRRRQLLNQVGFQFSVHPANIHEDFSIDLSPTDLTRHFAELKARSISAKFPDALVVGADTIVILGDTILGKPSTRSEAIGMLSNLSGKTHQVCTGVALIWEARRYSVTFHELTDVTFNPLSQIEIEYYVDQFKPFDKAGSYGIQDWFALHVGRISGCFYNVVGFPLGAFYSHYKAMCDSIGITAN